MRLNQNNINVFIQNMQTLQKVVKKLDEGLPKNIASQLHNYQNTQLPKEMIMQSMDAKQQAMMLKDLLNMPKEMKELLSLLVFKEVTPEKIAQILKNQAGNVDIEKLKVLLQDNGKELLNKLLKLANVPFQDSQNSRQLQSMLSLVQSFIPTQNTPANEVILNTMLLYLPWIPLTDGQKINMYFNQGENENNKESLDSLTIYLSTINLGNFKINLYFAEEKKLNIDINAEKGGEDIVNKALAQIKENLISIDKSTKPSISANIPNNNKNENQEGKKEVHFTQVSTTNPKLLLMAFSVVKLVFEEDEKVSLIENRKKML